MTHIHTTARTRGLLPAVLFPLSLSLSLSRGAACLRLSSPPPRLGLLLSSPNLSLARRINIALASPPSLASRASGRTDERAGSAASRRRGGGGGLCASVSLLPSSPPSPFSALLSIPAVQVSSLALFFVGDEMRLVTNLVDLRGALRLVVLCGFFPWISVD